MNTVIYIDVVRNKKKLINILIYTAAFLLACFVLSFIFDLVLPSVNNHFDFPQAIEAFLLFYKWHEHLYSNIWNLFAFIFPFIFIYILMVEFSCCIVEEEEFETLPYMRSLGIGRETILVSKLIVRFVWLLVLCVALFLENLIFFLLLNEKQMILTAGAFSLKILIIGLFHFTIALFIASCSKREKTCAIACGIIVLAEFLIARLHSYIRLLADTLFVSGKKYNEIEWLYGISAKLEGLKILSPIKLCYPGQTVSMGVGICMVLMAVVFALAGYTIYNRDQIVFRNR